MYIPLHMPMVETKQYKKAGGSWRSESVEFDELTDQLDEYITSKQVKMAKGIANDPRHKGGDMTGASKKMEKIKKGLSNHPGQEGTPTCKRGCIR